MDGMISPRDGRGSVLGWGIDHVPIAKVSLLSCVLFFCGIKSSTVLMPIIYRPFANKQVICVPG